MHRKQKIPGYLWMAVLIFLYQCAHVVAPSGGPKDETPPRIVESTPSLQATNFNATKISIEFNEYIQLKDIKSNLLVSPPMEEDPEITVKGKSLQIELLSELEDSTTYNIFMGDAVCDYNESNPINNFQYVFSTGDYIDSMVVEGKVLNAYNLQPIESVKVMLYNQMEDSIPYKEIPQYVASTDEEGHFQINNIRKDEYMMFALEDQNSNYVFDIPSERIAFLDSLVNFSMQEIIVSDTVFATVPVDSSGIMVERTDSSTIDTVITTSYTGFPINDYYLLMFEEVVNNQYLKTSSRPLREKVEVVFNKTLIDTPSIKLLGKDTMQLAKNWYFQEEPLLNDTLRLWLKDTALIAKKDINLVLRYPLLDSLDNRIEQQDTIRLAYTQEEIDTTVLELKTSLDGSKYDLEKPIRIEAGYPIENIDTSRIKLAKRRDSLLLSVNYEYILDSSSLRRVYVYPDLEPDSSYQLTVYPYAFRDIYEHVNKDTLQIGFRMQSTDYYGQLIIDMTNPDSSQLILQVLDTKEEEKILREQLVPAGNGKIVFSMMHPGEYLLKAIKDSNGNGEWDTGDYLKNRQPEELFYYNEKVKVRSNWDVEINWQLKLE